MTILAEGLTRIAHEIEAGASAVAALELERDYYKRQAKQWAEVVDRQKLNYAEAVQLEEFEKRMEG
jgi:hypothetical protein